MIKKTHLLWKTIDELCLKSKNLYNYGNYIVRQEFFNNGSWIRYTKLFSLCKDSEQYKIIGSNVGQSTLRTLDKNWQSFFASIKELKNTPDKYKFLGYPKPPKYKSKDGRFVLGIDNNKVMIKDNYIYFSWKPLKILNNQFNTNIYKESKILQCRFIPKENHYMMEIVYEIEVPDIRDSVHNIVSVDLGVDNFVTITNNIGLEPIVIKGGIIKSINQYYNKQKANMQSELMIKNKLHWSNKLQRLTDKRNNKIKYLMHEYSKKIIEYCIYYNIDTMVVGYNKGWKQESVMSSRVNQNFIGIPYEMFIHQLFYKGENNGIKFITTDESYTSGTSFLDNEEPIKENYNKSRRIHRGLFKSNNGTLINADVNGSYQIMKKVFPNAFANGIEGVGLHPTSMKNSVNQFNN